MEKLQKWQVWTVIVVLSTVVALAIGGIYFLLTKDNYKEAFVKQPPAVVEENVDLNSAKESLQKVDELVLDDIDTAIKELDTVDLSGL